MTKINKEVRLKVAKMASKMPVYHERFGVRKLISKKDAQLNYEVPADQLNKIKSLTVVENNGARLIDAKVHEKRMLNAIKKDPIKGYRNYLDKFNTMEFKRYTWFDYIKLYFGIKF